MKALLRLVPAAAAAMAAVAFAAPAAFAAPSHHADGGAVFALTDNPAGNAVVAYHRAFDGTLTPAGSYPTRGLGGVLTGSVVDHTASEGALAYDQADGLLIAVNPGSDTISVFGVYGDRLALRQVLPSGGDFPVSVTVHGDHAYVLDALGGGSLSGYRIADGRLAPLPGSQRALGLGTTAATQFTATPGQVSFTPDGSQLLVTTKATGNDVDVFAVGPRGRLSASPTVNSLPGDVPFDVAFDAAGHVVLTEAGPNAVATFALAGDGKLTQLAVADTGQMATCWVVRAGQYFYVSNAGSGSESGYRVGSSGGLTALGNTATDAGTVDAASAGRFLYVQAGKAGLVDEFAVGAGGALTPIGSVTVPGGAGGEGIAAA
ncbi:MAG TPA: beta-propeller fold lactonase family protein [Trebonia sp.]|nr:beta-propeller fold lactonase family protein [Trebonia sp.]